MVVWFTVVVEAKCLRQPVSSLFPHSGIRKRGGNKATISVVVLYNLASDTNRSHATRVTTLWSNLFLSVIYSYGIVFIDKRADFSARSQSIRFSLICAP